MLSINLRKDMSRRPSDVSSMCWSCAMKQQRLYVSAIRPRTNKHSAHRRASFSNGSGAKLRSPSTVTSLRPGDAYPAAIPLRFSRRYHASSRLSQHVQSGHAPDAPVFNPAIHELDLEDQENERAKPISNIREQLKRWNDVHGHEKTLDFSEGDDVNEDGEASNSFTRLGDMDNFRRPREAEENERDDLSQIAQARADELDDYDPNHKFLRKGDLVELEFPHSERESIIAVFVRRVGTSPPQSQFYTVYGKWIHVAERQIQYAIPGWMDPDLIDPIIPFLPDQEVTDELHDRAQMFDLSVPRHVSAPLVSRMLKFQRESEDVYRKHATTLDSSHSLLAHATDLKFGSLEQISKKLIPSIAKDPKHMSLPALFAVRKALMRGGFAFGFDRRSHRLTGFIQIRSKEQVANVERVRNWMRQWQDDLANSVAASRKPRPIFSEGADHVNNFVTKVRGLIRKSRETREPTLQGRVAPSKKRFEITKDQNAVQVEYTVEFSSEDQQLIRFMEGWACSNLFLGLPRVEALPPLILQATGLYHEHPLSAQTGFLFLQEIGVLFPHENRVRFDQHLLLPVSQHSKPLEHLMTTVLKLKDEPKFVDSMAGLRKDWGDLPVFCIDQEGAHEIDDGLSLEKVGEREYWVHVHIANPTAFFSRNRPLAKMARHMTETIYMPERAFMMLPRWSTQGHFSLRNNRPCLTFSARMNLDGETLERKVTPGIIRNVRFISPNEVFRVLGVDKDVRPDVTLTVGGTIPHVRPKKTADSLTEGEIQLLQTMQDLAVKRQSMRRSAGGLFFDSQQPEISVWNNYKHSGLGWDHPSRHAARYTEGEPIIQYRSKELISYFTTGEGVSDILVREMMLLACEIGAEWCAERNIPVIYRGTIPHPYSEDPEKFYKDVLLPATEKNGGEAPMHLAIQYLRSSGTTVLTTTPLHHRVLGLTHYSKVTSPLRRYGDMIFHWQIEAALREEAKTNQSLIGSKRQDYLPFSTASLEQIATALQPRESMIRRTTRYGEDFWVSQLFFRAFHYGECELPSTFSAYVPMNPSTQLDDFGVILKEYSMACTMMKPDKLALGEAKAGDWWEVGLAQVDCFTRRVVMKPLRLISRWEA
ncbi:hypothetical protein MBLNU459_g0848t1 [Dothideomycetes sp. NU459]